MTKTVGVITIGQTPRVDMIPAIKPFFSHDTVILEKGVLDYKSEYEIRELAPQANQTTIVSRLKDGNKVIVAKEKILDGIQNLIDELNELKVDVILLACTGQFQTFQSKIPVIYPDYLLNNVVKGLFRSGNIGVIVPLEEQKNDIINKWENVHFTAYPEACSPYNFCESDLIRVTNKLDILDIDAIVLDCMGYTGKMKSIVQKHTNKKVLLSRNVIYRLISELL